MMEYLTILLALVASVVAQNYSTITIPTGCLSTRIRPNTMTITDTVTSTYCPVCDEAKSNGDVYTTTYATVYSSVCPTGLIPVTYTVTQECTGTTPINTLTPPPGYTTTAVECSACEHSATGTATAGVPIVTITIPCTECVSSATPIYSTPVTSSSSATSNVQSTITSTNPAGQVTVYVASGTSTPATTATLTPPVEQFTGAASSSNAVGISAVVAIGTVFFAMLEL